MIAGLLDAIAQSSIALWMTENLNAFAWVESAHVMAIALVFGTILMVDLRLLGLASRSLDLGALARGLLPVTWIAFGLAVVTGYLMFATNPYGYFENTAFRFKMLLLLAAGANMAVFHLVGYARALAADGAGQPPIVQARLAGFLSILIWLSVITAGRLIGFTINAF